MKRRYWILAIVLIVAIASIACSANSSSSAKYDDGYYVTAESAYGAYDYDEAYAAESPMMAAANTSATSAKRSDAAEPMKQETARKLIRDASVTVETKQFDSLMNGLETQIVAFGGYVESMNEYGNSYRRSGTRSANVYARIPADQLDAFLGEVEGIGNVTQKSLSTRDVTSTYVDIESRLKVLETEKESLQKIMASAETTTDMLETQSRLYDVIEEIESYEAQKRTFDSLISYSSVSISIQEVVDLTPAKEETRWEELSRRFTTSLGDLGEAIVDFCIDFVVALPWLLVFGVVSGILFLIIFLPIHRSAKKRRAKKEAANK